MKTLIFVLAFGLSSMIATAQNPEVSSSGDTTEIVIGKKIISVTDGKVQVINKDGDDESDQEWAMDDDHDHDGDKKKKRNTVDVDFLAIDLGMNFLTQDMDFNLDPEWSDLETKPLGSTHLGLHLAKTRINLIKNKVNLVTAITFDNNRYSFRDNVHIQPDQDELTIVIDSNDYRKSKLITWHAQIPLLLNFQTKPGNSKRNFHFSIGGYAGLLIGSSTKRKGDEIGKIKQQDDYNLNNIRYGVTGRIGFGPLDLYMNYNLSSMFREDQGPEIMPVNFGVSLTGIM